MALIDASPLDGTRAALAPLGGWPDSQTSRRSGAINMLLRRFLAWRAQRETVQILAAVDAATLRDLGVTDIESTVYGDPRDRMRGYDRDWKRRARDQ